MFNYKTDEGFDIILKELTFEVILWIEEGDTYVMMTEAMYRQ